MVSRKRVGCLGIFALAFASYFAKEGYDNSRRTTLEVTREGDYMNYDIRDPDGLDRSTLYRIGTKPESPIKEVIKLERITEYTRAPIEVTYSPPLAVEPESKTVFHRGRRQDRIQSRKPGSVRLIVTDMEGHTTEFYIHAEDTGGAKN